MSRSCLPFVQAEKIQKGCDIIVSTPGRLKDFMQQGIVDLSGVLHAVLDEADEMLTRGFQVCFVCDTGVRGPDT